MNRETATGSDRELVTLLDGLVRLAQQPCPCGKQQRGLDESCGSCKRANVVVATLAGVKDDETRRLLMRSLLDRLPKAATPKAKASAPIRRVVVR